MGRYDRIFTNYKFSIDDFPKRCKAVMVGIYALDPTESMGNLNMYKEDEGNDYTLKYNVIKFE